LDERALAAMFNRCLTTIKRAVARGELPRPVRLLGRPVWLAGAVLEHLAKRLEAAKREAAQDAARISRLCH
jgi:predicted DNA-binding transcriptional regulator AlpA